MINKIALRLILWILPGVLAYFFYILLAHGEVSLLSCSFYQDTSLECPGCGGQRALLAIGQGKFLLALEYNALIYFFIVLLLYCYIALIEVWIFKNTFFLANYGLPWWFSYFFLAVVLIYFIARNFTRIKEFVIL